VAEPSSDVHVAEVEKQLQGSATPQLAYKKPHAGSTGNIHGLVMVTDQVAAAGMVAGQYSIGCQRCTTGNLAHNLLLVLMHAGQTEVPWSWVPFQRMTLKCNKQTNSMA
jgi:hypothetical protein